MRINTAAPIAASAALIVASLLMVLTRPDFGVASVALAGVVVGALSARMHWKGRDTRA